MRAVHAIALTVVLVLGGCAKPPEGTSGQISILAPAPVFLAADGQYRLSIRARDEAALRSAAFEATDTLMEQARTRGFTHVIRGETQERTGLFGPTITSSGRFYHAEEAPAGAFALVAIPDTAGAQPAEGRKAVKSRSAPRVRAATPVSTAVARQATADEAAATRRPVIDTAAEPVKAGAAEPQVIAAPDLGPGGRRQAFSGARGGR